ncbi:hypothetical protein [Tropicibacter naphthalenivorans]|uniref:Uncharacterized protein n=1 Tax=Tropicibacter naphthalenivorans TaxID=441103 RepID=A0A0P1FZY8_9RHOB|nr:hypothetical protein [Tropicibacter naphthalenivorans]CUH74979.1 hypothetical protein TRN7648_00180 [Tropicibacter naphthalenivorans]SMC47658.1 hypothetical protein SAMN04488093_101698 [Tropicibacter naphthalenivorans]
MDLLVYTKELFGISLAFLNAARAVGRPIAEQKLRFILHQSGETPVSLSSLSDVLLHDRKTLRAYLDVAPSDSIIRSAEGYSFTAQGRRDFETDVAVFIDNVAEPFGTALHRAFQGAADPQMAICELGLSWDTMSIKTGYSKAYLSTFIAIWLAHQDGGAAPKDIIAATTFSDQAVRAELAKLRKAGHVRMRGRLTALTVKGQLHATQIVLKGVSVANAKTLKDMAKTVYFAKFPHQEYCDGPVN